MCFQTPNTPCSCSSVSLEALARHAVDDAVATRVHEPDSVAHGGDGESKHDHRPQDDVEYDRILVRVDRVHIQLPLQASVATGRLSPTKPSRCKSNALAWNMILLQSALTF